MLTMGTWRAEIVAYTSLYDTQSNLVFAHKCIQYTEEHLYVYILVNTSRILLLPNHWLRKFSFFFFLIENA